VPGTTRKIDVAGIHLGEEPSFIAIEVKCGLDGRIQDVPRQLEEYLDIFDPDGGGLRPDVAESYSRVCTQLLALGLDAPDPRHVTAGMPVEGLVVLGEYNQRSRLLPRAHALATTLSREMYLVDFQDDDYRIPPRGEWKLLGQSSSPT